MKKICVDSDIPYIKGVIEPYFDVQYLKGEDFTSQNIADASALIIRTRTKCNKELLNNSLVEIIATATIGFDHINTLYCAQNNIKVTTAQGCNASAVIQYVFGVCSALFNDVKGKKIAIIGCGNVGGLLARCCAQVGMIPLCSDAPLKDKKGDFPFELLDVEDAISRADIVSVHVPLNREGKYKTENIISTHLISKMKKGSIFINSSRGDVVDEEALVYALENKKIACAAIDVWRNEPNINRELVAKCQFTTSHIAGYSRKGKENATEMAVNAIGQHFKIEELANWKIESVHPTKLELNWDNIHSNIKSYFDIEEHTTTLKNNIKKFELLRSTYNYREEFF